MESHKFLNMESHHFHFDDKDWEPDSQTDRDTEAGLGLTELVWEEEKKQ